MAVRLLNNIHKNAMQGYGPVSSPGCTCKSHKHISLKHRHQAECTLMKSQAQNFIDPTVLRCNELKSPAACVPHLNELRFKPSSQTTKALRSPYSNHHLKTA